MLDASKVELPSYGATGESYEQNMAGVSARYRRHK